MSRIDNLLLENGYQLTDRNKRILSESIVNGDKIVMQVPESVNTNNINEDTIITVLADILYENGMVASDDNIKILAEGIADSSILLEAGKGGKGSGKDNNEGNPQPEQPKENDQPESQPEQPKSKNNKKEEPKEKKASDENVGAAVKKYVKRAVIGALVAGGAATAGGAIANAVAKGNTNAAANAAKEIQGPEDKPDTVASTKKDLEAKEADVAAKEKNVTDKAKEAESAKLKADTEKTREGATDESKEDAIRKSAVADNELDRAKNEAESAKQARDSSKETADKTEAESNERNKATVDAQKSEQDTRSTVRKTVAISAGAGAVAGMAGGAVYDHAKKGQTRKNKKTKEKEKYDAKHGKWVPVTEELSVKAITSIKIKK